MKGSLDSLPRGRLENVEPGFDKRSGIWQKEILKEGKSERVEPKLRRSASVARISKEGEILQSGVCVSGSSHLDVVVGSSSHRSSSLGVDHYVESLDWAESEHEIGLVCRSCLYVSIENRAATFGQYISCLALQFHSIQSE